MRKENQEIDFVITWVDGSDREWLQEKRIHESQATAQGREIDSRKERYRNWGFLVYWLRGVEKYAPWVRKIHLVTSDIVPAWLNTEHPKLHIVRHGDIIPKEFLPTYNSNVIELYLHRIEGLAEQFVYFNDDMFLTGEVAPSDFFRKGLPCDMLAFQPVVANPANPVMSHLYLNNMMVLSKYFGKRANVKKQPGAYYHFGYPVLYFAYNILEMMFPQFTGLYTVHDPFPLLKSIYSEVWEKEKELLCQVSSHKFREKEDVTPYLMREWQKLSGKFCPCNITRRFRYFEIGRENGKLLKAMGQKKVRIICMNDVDGELDFAKVKSEISNAFEKKLSKKSSFEKTDGTFLFQSLREALKPEQERESLNENEVGDWNSFLKVAEKHKVLSLLYDVLQPMNLSAESRKVLDKVSKRIVKQNYRLLFLSRDVQEILQKENIKSVLLKGVATASFYPVPELRKSGDVDLLLPYEGDVEKGCEILQEKGYKVKEIQHAHHHVVLVSPDGIDVELHGMLAEPFDNEKMNRYLKGKQESCASECEKAQVMGLSLWVLKPGYHAYELLLHMLQHFLRSGFGLKLLCDWVVFWNSEVPETEREKYLELIRESGLEGFSAMVTAACVEYLGLKRENACHKNLPDAHLAEQFILEVLQAEEFGKSAKNRMVAMRGNGLWDYVREFHHQMHLNFPGMGKVWLFWPVLWVITLARFLNNNRKLNRGSGMAIIRKAGERSELIRHMELFEK
ncbi:MAG: Stealth CR1 domain-containing protein [Lachnospiraceae bacterium]|nr:Stealth CR1 domain-containing protein [Lachnospiraceae bacterium]